MIRFVIGAILFFGSAEQLFVPGLLAGFALAYWGVSKGRVFKE